jgi:peptidoglycan/LPS O-acetylase OafA/YrhL
LLIPQDWSLGVELKGSALIPVFLLLVRRSIPGLAVAVMALVIFHPTGYWYMSFAVGVWAARYYRRMESPLRLLGIYSKWAMLTAGVLLYESRPIAHYFWDFIDGGAIDKIVWCLASMGCAFIMAASMCSRRIQSKLNLRPVLLLGRISYSVYLVQFIVILCVLAPLIPQLNAAGVHQMALLLTLTLSAGILATVALSLITYYSVEVPSMALGRWLTKLIQGRWAKHNS